MPIPPVLANAILAILPKKRIAAYIGAAILGVLAFVAGINSAELKDAVCARDAVVIEKPVEVRAPATDVSKDAVKELKK